MIFYHLSFSSAITPTSLRYLIDKYRIATRLVSIPPFYHSPFFIIYSTPCKQVSKLFPKMEVACSTCLTPASGMTHGPPQPLDSSKSITEACPSHWV